MSFNLSGCRMPKDVVSSLDFHSVKALLISYLSLLSELLKSSVSIFQNFESSKFNVEVFIHFVVKSTTWAENK